MKQEPVEFIYVERTLSVHIDGEQALEAGDAMYFDASIPHAYRRSGGRCAAPSSSPLRERLCNRPHS